MAVQLVRIDDRLIHGQVVIGWANFLNTREIVLCDDSVSENDWEKELYLSCVPESIKTHIMNVAETTAFINNRESDHSSAMILINSPAVLEELLKSGAQIERVNIGGIHFQDARKKYLPYLYINNEEMDAFRRCMERGVQFECLDVPTGKKIAFENLIGNS